MPHHVWGDEWEHWNDLHTAIRYCMNFWRRWGRIGSHGKEKFGTFRHHMYFYRTEWPIHELFKPGHVYYRWGKRFMRFEKKLGKVVRFLRLHRPIQRYQQFIYNYALQKACAKYPAIVDELVSDSDFPEFIKGKVDGQKIHDKYWTKVSCNE